MTAVLITGVGSEGAYGVIRSLREYDATIRIVGLDTNACTAHRQFVDMFEVPPIRTSTEYIPFVMDRLRNYNCDVCWPIPTDELELFAAHRHVIETSTSARVMIGEPDGIQIANDKLQLYRHLEAHGIDVVPPYRVARSVAEMDDAVQTFGYPSTPVVIKPVRGAGSQGFRILDGSLDRRREYFRRLSLQQRVRWEDVRPVFAEDGDFPDMLVTAHLPGSEWDVDVLAHNGNVLAAVTRESHAMFGGMATDAEVHHNECAAAQAKTVVRSLGLSWIHNIAFKADTYGHLRILEINPRVPGTIIAATRAGVNLPALALCRLLDHPLPEPLPTATHTRLVRYWDDLVLA